MCSSDLVEVYEKQISQFCFHLIREYVFELSFLTTLYIYKDYFEARQGLYSCTSVEKSLVHANCDKR